MAQQPVELILARQLASGLAVPVLLVDASGDTVFFNEPAELLLARRFDDIDALNFGERTKVLSPLRKDGSPLPVEELPGILAITQRHPAHAEFYIHGFDGVLRSVEVTAIPLEGSGGRVLGALVVLWARPPGTPDAPP